MANKDMAAMDSGLMDPSGRDQTNAGKICGIIATIIGIIAVLGMIAYFLIIFVFIGAAAVGASGDFESMNVELQP